MAELQDLISEFAPTKRIKLATPTHTTTQTTTTKPTADWVTGPDFLQLEEPTTLLNKAFSDSLLDDLDSRLTSQITKKSNEVLGGGSDGDSNGDIDDIMLFKSPHSSLSSGFDLKNKRKQLLLRNMQSAKTIPASELQSLESFISFLAVTPLS